MTTSIDNDQPVLGLDALVAMDSIIPSKSYSIDTRYGPASPGFPIGSIRYFACSFDRSGTALAAGQGESIPDHAALFYVLGTAYGASGRNDINGSADVVGRIAPFLCPSADGDLPCGSILDAADDPELFDVLGNTCGGDGASTFALPDLRGRLAIGSSSFPLGMYLEQDDRAIAIANLPRGPTPVDDHQPSLALNDIIAAQGLSPQRDGSGSSAPSNDSALIGEVTAYAGTAASVPPGWMLAQDQTLSVAS